MRHATPSTDPPPTAPASPPARRLRPASWTDRRLLLGVALVVGSVAGTVAVVTAADDTVPVWSAREDLAPGMTVTADDVELADVRLPSTDAYLSASADPVGAVVRHPVAGGELLPASAVVSAGAAPDRRLVTVPVDRHHLPIDLGRGEQVDVYLVERDATGSTVGDPLLVLAAATVDAVDDGATRFGGSTLQTGVVLAVDPTEVTAVVSAAARGSVVLVRVPGA